jgi:ABC-type multidrug transport system fused ATPase/permease subunit
MQTGVILTQVLMTTVSLILAFVLGDVMVTLVMLAMLPLMAIAMSIYMVLMTGGGAGADSLGTEAGRVVGEITTSIRTIAAFTMEKGLDSTFSQMTDKMLSENVVKKANSYVIDLSTLP